MNVALRRPMSREEFLDWGGHLEGRYEFDGIQPVAMTGGTLLHDALTFQLRRELDRLLSGGACRAFGPNGGMATVGSAVRYPDVLVTCSPVEFRERLVPDPVVVFEVVSPSSVITDRVTKLREYAAVSSVRRYAILEAEVRAATLFYRGDGEDLFRAEGIGQDQVLALPEIGIELPMSAVYDGIVAPGLEEDEGR